MRFIDPLGLCSRSLGETIGSQVQWMIKAGGLDGGLDPNGPKINVTIGVSATTRGITGSLTHEGSNLSGTTSPGGLSIDVIFGNTGKFELGMGKRHLGAGINFNKYGLPVGLSTHTGASIPTPFPFYFAVTPD